MPSFELYERYEIKDGMTTVQVANIIKTSLELHYDEGKITVTPTGVRVNGNLNGSWERAITKAEINLDIVDKCLICHVKGNASLGKIPWIWAFLGLFTGIFFAIFLFDLVEYLLCRDRPKQYIREILDALRFKIG